MNVHYCWLFGWGVRKRSGVTVRRSTPAGGADTLITTHALRNVLKLVGASNDSKTAKCVCLFKTNRAVGLKFFRDCLGFV